MTSTPPDLIRLCLFCRHWFLDGGSAGYSEYTPGYTGSTGCRKDVWKERLMTDIDDDDDFRALMGTALTCDLYEPARMTADEESAP